MLVNDSRNHGGMECSSVCPILEYLLRSQVARATPVSKVEKGLGRLIRVSIQI